MGTQTLLRSRKGFIGAVYIVIFLLILAIAILAGSVAYVPEATTAVCSVIVDAIGKGDIDHCIKGVAQTVGNAGLCDSIVGPSAMIDGKSVQVENPPKMECITKVAEKKRNPALCEQVEGLLMANTKIDCVFRVAKAARDPSMCGRIGDAEQSRMGFSMNQESCKAQAGGSSPPATTGAAATSFACPPHSHEKPGSTGSSFHDRCSCDTGHYYDPGQGQCVRAGNAR